MVPVIRLEHLTDAQARAFRIADNQIALNAGWDDALLGAELARLQEDGLDLDLLGFGAEDLDRLMAEVVAGETEQDPDAVSEPPVDPVRPEEHTSELQSLMRISSAVICLKKKQNTTRLNTNNYCSSSIQSSV